MVAFLAIRAPMSLVVVLAIQCLYSHLRLLETVRYVFIQVFQFPGPIRVPGYRIYINFYVTLTCHIIENVGFVIVNVIHLCEKIYLTIIVFYIVCFI